MDVPMYEIRIASSQYEFCEFVEHTIEFTKVHNWHKDIEIMFVTNGSGYINYNTEKIAMTPNDIIIINSDAMHRTFCENGKSVTYHYLIIYESFCKKIGIDLSQYIFDQKINDQKIWDIYNQLLNITDNKETMIPQIYSLKLLNTLTYLIIELLDKHTIIEKDNLDKNTSSIELIKRALEYITKYYMNHITLDDIAKYSTASKYRLSKEFKKYLGQTIFEYINVIRCKNAHAFISDGMSISEAAYKCGFENMSYFSKTFKKYVGVLPSKIMTSEKKIGS